MLKREGWKVNHKTVQKIYLEERLKLRTKTRKRREAVLRVARAAPTAVNEFWSMDSGDGTSPNTMSSRMADDSAVLR